MSAYNARRALLDYNVRWELLRCTAVIQRIIRCTTVARSKDRLCIKVHKTANY